jgi:Zn ribbon nucleic-acid-binding protein
MLRVTLREQLLELVACVQCGFKRSLQHFNDGGCDDDSKTITSASIVLVR